MDTRKLLVADASAELCGALADVMGGTYELRICHDGLQAKALVESFRPDILVLDLALPGLDGISVLRDIAAGTCRPAILVTIRYSSPYIERAVGALGVDYVMMKPYDLRALAERIHDLTECSEGAVYMLPSPQRIVTNMLLALNVATKWMGFRYLEAAVELYDQKPGQSVTKELYPAVAKLFDTNGQSVERAIRSAIHLAWERRDEAVWRMYFTAGRNGSVPRPTNTIFIANLAQQLRRQCEAAQ